MENPKKPNLTDHLDKFDIRVGENGERISERVKKIVKERSQIDMTAFSKNLEKLGSNKSAFIFLSILMEYDRLKAERNKKRRKGRLSN